MRVERDGNAAAWSLRRYSDESRTLGNSALITAPLVLLYEVGILALGDRGVRNAAEVLIDQGVWALGRPAALVVNMVVLGIFVWFALRASPRKATPFGLILPVIVESALYAGVLAVSLTLARRLLAAGGVPLGPMEGLVLSLGAGFYEELVFRLAGVGGTLWLLRRIFGVTSGWVVLAVILVSGVAFSWFHHLGRGAEPFTVPAFVMRSVAGILLGSLYIIRGFGVGCYTHVLYDVLCLSIRAG